MNKPFKCVAVMALIAALALAPIVSSAGGLSIPYDVSDGSMAGDFFLCRPLGLAATVIGSVLFVVSLPFSALGDNVGQAADLLVVEPAKFTFDRPLGKFK